MYLRVPPLPLSEFAYRVQSFPVLAADDFLRDSKY